jgi:Domain of unknown function (DUF4032)/Lipopolysaccharide kinase (Kdo/WaaP) family
MSPAPPVPPAPLGAAPGLAALQVLPGHPDFLDLPWDAPLAGWRERCERIVEVPRGLSRHEVLFVEYAQGLYAVKELPAHLGEREYDALRWLEERGLPTVVAAGHARVGTPAGPGSVLITRFLDASLPFRTLFQTPGLERYRERLLDSVAGLLVRLHLAGFMWGDFSLSNCLFKRDAGELQAYLVDAETSEMHPALSTGQRHLDLQIMEENVAGELADLSVVVELPPALDVFQTGAQIRRRYEGLWTEITREEVLSPSQHWRIQERIRALNALGFSVSEVELIATGDGSTLRMRTIVTDRDYHRHTLHTLTGVVAEERQAAQMMNEIRELRATVARAKGKQLPLGVAAYQWLTERYEPTVRRLAPFAGKLADAPELYCQVLEHKWFLSERAGRDVGLVSTLEDFLRKLQPAQA